MILAPPKALRSTTLKLTGFFVLSCFAVILIVESGTKLLTDHSERKILYRSQTRLRYSRLLVAEFEQRGDVAASARRLADETEVGLRIEDGGGHVVFATDAEIPPIATVEAESVRRIWTDTGKAGEFHGLSFSVVTSGERKYLFAFRSTPFQELQLQWIVPMTAIIILILFANFLMIRWLFRPVAWLSDGIRRLGDGDFDIRVPCRSHDELGDLAESFNLTVERVRAIVESKRQLLLDVSHELRSPLTRIKVALELGGDRAREQIRKDVVLLDAMIHDLLESARLDSFDGALSLEASDLSELLSRTTELVGGEKPGVIFRRPERPFVLALDRKRVEACVKNVLDNALKYSRLQSRPVELSVAQCDGPLGGPSDARPGSSVVRVTVRDFGVGVPIEESEKIFEPFYRVDKSRLHATGGYGLGLSLCRKIMVAHGGRIAVARPESGQGAVFTLDFRLDPRAPLGR